MQRHDLLATVLVATTACSAPPPRSGPARDDPPPSADVTSAIAEAERALEEALQLDYVAPRDREPRRLRLEAAGRRFVSACRLGDRRSCWRAAIVLDASGSLADAIPAVAAVGDACLDGDVPSCRALTSGDVQDVLLRSELASGFCERGLAAGCMAMVPSQSWDDRRSWIERGCALHDGAACHDVWVAATKANAPSTKADPLRTRAVQLLSAECERGFAQSCATLVSWHDGDALRVVAAAEPGCQGGLVDDCELLVRHAADAVQRSYGAEQVCSVRGERCGELAALATTKEAVRDALERGCQAYVETQTCLELARGYLSRELAEPISGRGRALAKYLCESSMEEACALLSP